MHYFDEANKQQMQEKARQKYCLVYPTDWVCHGQMSGVPYIVTIQDYNKGLRFGGVYKLRVYGPIEGVIRVNYDWQYDSGYTAKVFIRARDSAGIVFDYLTIGAGGSKDVWNSLNTEILNIVREDGKPDTGGPLPWQYWSQEKQEQALKLLAQPDFEDETKSMPPGVGLNPGDNINDQQIIIPGQPKDDPNTPEDESKTRVVPGPLTIPGTPPSPPPAPSIFPSPQPLPTASPSPEPSPTSPSPSPTAPTASGDPPSPPPNPLPSPQPAPTPPTPPPSPEPEPAPDAGGAMEGNGGSRLNWNWKSKPTFGHTFETHGQGSKNTKQLTGRATSTKDPQGQWLNNQKAAEFLQDLRSSISQTTIVEIPAGLGQVILPNGTIVPATHALVKPSRIGGYRSAFPVVEPLPVIKP